MVAQQVIHFPLHDDDSKQLPALHRYFQSFWSGTQEEARTKYNRFIAHTPVVDQVQFRPATTSAIPGLWCEPDSARADRVLLYLHGGAYSLGNADAYRGFVSQIASRTRCSAFMLEYPLAPEASLPVALDLAIAAVESLLTVYPQISIVGDSAGGGLTLATLANLRDSSHVASAVTFSPWTDLTLSGASIREKARADLLLVPASLATAAAGYAGAFPLKDPRASPLFGVPSSLPPLLIQVGSEEILLDDSLRYAAIAREKGLPVTLEVWQGMHHVFQLDVKTLRSSRLALDRAAAFLAA
jgi:epsilon-lactone hydrolase